LPFPTARARRAAGLLSAVTAFSAVAAFAAGAAQAAPSLDYQATPVTAALTPVDTATAQTIHATHQDDEIGTITAPFPVTLYGATSTTLNVDTNGYVGVGAGTDPGPETSVIPGHDYATPLLAPFSIDLLTANDGGVYAETRGTTPHRQLVLEWDVSDEESNSSVATGRFQAIFDEGSLIVHTRYAGTLEDGQGDVTDGFIGTIEDSSTYSTFGAAQRDYPADGTGLDVTPTGLTATTDARSTSTHPVVTGEALDTSSDVAVNVYAGADTTVAPVATRTVTPDAVTGDYTVTFDAPTTTLAEGDYTVQAVQTDAGHEHASVAQAFAVDLTAPAPTLTSGPSGRVAPADVLFDGALTGAAGDTDGTLDIYDGATATGSPVDSVALDTDAGFTGVAPDSSLEDGTYTAQVSQPDAAGNVGHSTTFTFTVDGTGPNPYFPRGQERTSATPEFYGVADTDLGDDAFVTLTITHLAPPRGDRSVPTPVQQLTAAVDADGRFSGTATALPEGDYTVRVTQRDDLGNEGGGDSFDFTVDATAPAPTLTAPANGAAIAGGKPTFTGTAGLADGDYDAVGIAIWAGTDTNADPVQFLEAAIGADGKWSATPETALPAGTYTARVTQYDDTDNAGSATVTFTVPGAPAAPAPAPAAPAPVAKPAVVPAVCRSTRVVRKHVDLPSGRNVKVTATLDGKKAKVVTGAKSATVTVDLRDKAKGTHVLRVTTKRTITVTKTKNHHKVKSTKTVTTTAKTNYKVCL
jgi:hypothetical protein